MFFSITADVNECATGEHNCTALHQCINSPGLFICECYPGYTGDESSCTGKQLFNSKYCNSLSCCFLLTKIFKCV